MAPSIAGDLLSDAPTVTSARASAQKEGTHTSREGAANSLLESTIPPPRGCVYEPYAAIWSSQYVGQVLTRMGSVMVDIQGDSRSRRHRDCGGRRRAAELNESSLITWAQRTRHG